MALCRASDACTPDIGGATARSRRPRDKAATTCPRPEILPDPGSVVPPQSDQPPVMDVGPPSSDPRPGRLQLLVRSLQGSTLVLRLPAQATGSDLAEALAGRTGIPAQLTRLTHRGSGLRPTSPLVTQGVRDGDVIHTLAHLRGGMTDEPGAAAAVDDGDPNREIMAFMRPGTPTEGPCVYCATHCGVEPADSTT